MNLTLTLSLETEVKLREQALLTGKSLEELAIEALQDRLADATESQPLLNSSEWKQHFDTWVNSHASRNPLFDDSRDSMYSDRS